jgi:serine/threonine protein kinase
MRRAKNGRSRTASAATGAAAHATASARAPAPPVELSVATAPSRIGHYEIIQRVGVGGMAQAFRAKARGPGGYERELIIKCIVPDHAQDPDFLRLFIAEAKILGMLNHPNIVQVYDFGEDNGRHFLALEFLDGPSVAQILALLTKTGLPVPVAVAAYIAREMCLGLGAAHGLRGPDGHLLNVVHRDVTPANVMTTTAGEVKLVDFGVARLGPAGTATRSGTVRGKPAYLSPEQILGAEIDGRADVFSAGAVLYEMLTLKPLFLADNDLATIYRVMHDPIAPPSTLRAQVPPEIDRIVLKALERPPGARYQTAGEMAAELTEFVNKASVGREEIANFATMYRRLTAPRSSPRLRAAGSAPAPAAPAPRARKPRSPRHH